MLISLSVIALMNNYINNLDSAQEQIIYNIDRKFKIVSESVELVENSSTYVLKSSPICPIKYIIVYNYDQGDVDIISVHNYSVNIDKNLLKYNTELYVITCNGNIVKLYINTNSNSYVDYLSSIKWGLFQPGGKELIDPTICPISFSKYNNSYGSIEVNVTFSLYCYNGSGLVLDSPVLYFYNTFLVKNNNSNTIKLSLFLKGEFNIEYGTQNVALSFLERVYDLLTDVNIGNKSYPNILNLKAQSAVQGTSTINNSSTYIYAWNSYSSNIISGKFLVYLDDNSITTKHLTVGAVKVNQGIVITDRAYVAAPSTLTSVKFYLNTSFFNNSSFKVKKLPLNLEVNYTSLNDSYNLVIKTINGTIINKKMNTTDILLIIDKPMYEDKYVTIILEKVWLYKVLDEPVASLLIKIVSKRTLLSVLAYKTKEYLKIYNDAYPLKPTIEPKIIQKYYDGKILGSGDSTELFIQGYYITRYGGSPAHRFSLYLPYIVIVTNN